MKDPWSPIDPLGEALHFLRMSGVFYCRSEFTAPWALALPAMKGCLMFHVVIKGQCWIEVEGAEHRPLQPGDLALVPHGKGHRLASDPGIPAARLFVLRLIESAVSGSQLTPFSLAKRQISVSFFRSSSQTVKCNPAEEGAVSTKSVISELMASIRAFPLEV